MVMRFARSELLPAKALGVICMPGRTPTWPVAHGYAQSGLRITICQVQTWYLCLVQQFGDESKVGQSININGLPIGNAFGKDTVGQILHLRDDVSSAPKDCLRSDR